MEIDPWHPSEFPTPALPGSGSMGIISATSVKTHGTPIGSPGQLISINRA